MNYEWLLERTAAAEKRAALQAAFLEGTPYAGGALRRYRAASHRMNRLHERAIRERAREARQ